jgi:hypothetical protein
LKRILPRGVLSLKGPKWQVGSNDDKLLDEVNDAVDSVLNCFHIFLLEKKSSDLNVVMIPYRGTHQKGTVQ